MKRMMRVVMVLAVMAGLPGVAQTEVKPIMYQDCASLSSDLSFQDKPMGYEPGFKIYMMVTGRDLVSFDETSLDLEYIKLPGGEDISRTRSGKPAYEFGSFPKVTEDGKSALFCIESKVNVFGKAGLLSLKGKVMLNVGSKVSSAVTPEMDVSKSESKKAGDFTVKSGGMMDGMFNSSEGLAVTIVGQLGKISDVTFTLDGKKQETNGSFWTNDSKTYHLAKATTGKLVVKIDYWTDLVKKEVAFDVNPSQKAAK